MRDYLKRLTEADAAKYRAINEHLFTAAAAGEIITIEIEVDGCKLYLRDTSIFGEEPVPNPIDARNFADDAANEFNEMWYIVNVLYIKGEGGGRSAIRSDTPGQIVVFEQPKPIPKPPELIRFRI